MRLQKEITGRFVSKISGSVDSVVHTVSVSGSLGETLRVTCRPQTVCALRESTVKLECFYLYTTKPQQIFWFSPKQRAKWRNEGDPEDVALDSDYAGRVSYGGIISYGYRYAILTIRDLRERDSGKYHLMIISETGERYSSSTAVSLTVSGVFGETCWSVSYSDRRVCALEGSSVDFPCTYSHPSDQTVNEAFWYHIRSEAESTDLSVDEQFAGRVEFLGDKEKNCGLRMRNLTKGDSGQYQFRFITDNPNRFSGRPGVILSVTDLQVKASPTTPSKGQTVTLTCISTCTLPNNPTFVWYKNGQRVTNKPTTYNKLYLESASPEDLLQYSCALGAWWWECHGLGGAELQSIEGTMNADKYCDILKHSLIRSLQKLGSRGIFQHGNDPKHISKTTTALLKKLRVKASEWPSMSPDPNPRKVSNIYQLRDVIMEEWKRIPVATYEVLACLQQGMSTDLNPRKHDVAAAIYSNILNLAMTSDLIPREGSDNEDGIHYSSVQFKHSNKYGEAPPSTCTLHVTEDQDVQYAAVNFQRCASKTCPNNLSSFELWQLQGILKSIHSVVHTVSVSGSLGETLGVTCSPQTVCALRESTVNLECSYSYTIQPQQIFWFSPKQRAKWRNEGDPEDVALDSEYAGRVNYGETISYGYRSAILTIRDLRWRDSGQYHLMIISVTGERYSSSTAVSLTVSDLQMTTTDTKIQTQQALNCSTTCRLTSNPAQYGWYKNGRITYWTSAHMIIQGLYSIGPGSYSCSVSDQTGIRSNTVCVLDENCWSVSYSDRTVCALEGSSVDFPCTYSYPSDQTVNKAFWSYIRPAEVPTDLSVDEQFAGRVEFLGDKEGNCTLRMRNLTKSDSGQYQFRFISNKLQGFSGKPGVILSVTGLQVKASPTTPSEGQRVTLTCISTCTLPNNPTYVWYKNGQRVTNNLTTYNKLYLESASPEDLLQYSCALGGTERLDIRTVLKCLAVSAAVFLVLFLIFGWIRTRMRKPSPDKEQRSTEEREQCDAAPVYSNISDLAMTSQREDSGNQDGIHYSSVHFKRKQKEALPSTSTLPLYAIEDQDVQYADVGECF
ncbi:hypothetical protein NFI96_001480 [Prochilodus magdalenae]|nr:hypothetical protein NFI96_001480 [Prochilodus magdalenae]